MKSDPVKLVRRATWLWGLLRTGVGVVALASPATAEAPWVGKVRPRPAAAVLGRALGGRDIGLGVGMMAATRTDADLLPWIVAAGGADAVDAAATLAAWRSLPRGTRAVVLAAAGGSAVFGGVLAAAVAAKGTCDPGRPRC